MKHAGTSVLDRIEPLLAQLRDCGGFKEKSRGCFYLNGRSYLHFHEHGADEIYADIGFGDDFERLPAKTAAQHKAILSRARKAAGDKNKVRRR